MYDAVLLAGVYDSLATNIGTGKACHAVAIVRSSSPSLRKS
jgi:hypothetical protein